METGASNSCYFLLADGELVRFDRSLLSYFGTITDILPDICIADPSTEPISLATTNITKPVIQWCIDTSLAHRRCKGNYRNQRESNLLFLIDVFAACDYLDAKILMARCLDLLYGILRNMSKQELESLLKENGEEEEAIVTQGINPLPLTPYYRREELIQRYLATNLLYSLPIPILHVRKYIDPIACSNSHRLFLNSEGLHGHGSNKYGELALKRIVPLHGETPYATSAPGKPLFIVCGLHISFCATDRGLYTCGSNIHEQMGIGSQDFGCTWIWHQVELKGEILLCEVGGLHTIVLTSTGLYGTGKNKFGQLGTGDTQERNYMAPIDVEGTVIAIACGKNHTIVLTTTGLYGCGRNDAMQLPVLEAGNVRRLTRLTGFDGTVLSIACNENATFILTSKTVYDSSLSLLDNQSKQYRLSPMPLPESGGIPITISVNQHRLFVLTAEGDLFTALRGSYFTVFSMGEDKNDRIIHGVVTHKEKTYVVANGYIYSIKNTDFYMSPDQLTCYSKSLLDVLALGWPTH